MRGLPFFKAKNKPQFAGLNFSNAGSSGGGGGGDTSALANKTDLTAIILTGTTNTSGSTITSGTWFYLNGVLVKAKVDIASGATFTLNTNYEEKTIGSALSELNSKSSKAPYNVGLINSTTPVEVDMQVNFGSDYLNFLVTVNNEYGEGGVWIVRRNIAYNLSKISTIVETEHFTMSSVSSSVVSISSTTASGEIHFTPI